MIAFEIMNGQVTSVWDGIMSPDSWRSIGGMRKKNRKE